MSQGAPKIFSLEWFLILVLAFLISWMLGIRRKREQEKHGKNWPEVQFARTNKFRTVTWFYIAFFIYVMLLFFGLGAVLEGVSLEGVLSWLGILLFTLAFLLVALIPNWVYNDAKKRGMEDAANWANSIGLTRRLWPFIYLFGYLLERKKFPIVHSKIASERTKASSLVVASVVWLFFAVLFFLFFVFIFYSQKYH